MDVVHRLNDITFVWDSGKALVNLQKHGVSLDTACEVFFDPFIHFLRTEVVWGEERELSVGMTQELKLLVVVYTLREDFIRLISARAATTQERRTYEDGPDA